MAVLQQNYFLLCESGKKSLEMCTCKKKEKGFVKQSFLYKIIYKEIIPVENAVYY